jgi:hypothetical protein
MILRGKLSFGMHLRWGEVEPHLTRLEAIVRCGSFRKITQKKTPMSTSNINATDLTQRPPRSVRVRIGGYAGLPRMLDKGRATIVGKNGEYHFNCPLDQRVLSFLGIEAEALKAQLSAGKGDGEILEWINTNAKNKRSEWETDQWSNYMERRGPNSDPDTLNFFVNMVGQVAKGRGDIQSFADLLDLDDYATFGGKV